MVEGEPSDAARSAIRETLQGFPDQVREQIRALAALLDGPGPEPDEETGLAQATAVVHRLAGSTATMGYPEVGRIAGALEILLLEVADLPQGGLTTPVRAQIDALLGRLQTAGACMTIEGSTLLHMSGPDASRPWNTRPGDGDPAHPCLLLIGALPGDPWSRLADRLDAYGWRVLTQPDGLTADIRDVSADPAPDLLVIDCDTVPNGPALGRRLCGLDGGVWPGVPWYLAQIEPGLEVRMEAAACGCAGVLEKPFSAERLLDHFADVCAARREDTMRAVVLDSDPALGAVTRFLLEGAGLHVEHAAGPASVLKALKEDAADVAVLVERAAARGAADLAAAIRQDPTFDVPGLVLVLSDDDADPVAWSLARGGDVVLIGPMDPDLMPALVAGQASRALGRRRRSAREGRGPVLLANGLLRRLDRAMRRARTLSTPLTVAWVGLSGSEVAQRSDKGADPPGITHDEAEAIVVRLLGQVLTASDDLGRGPAAGLALVLPSASRQAAEGRLRPALEAMSRLAPGYAVSLGLANPETETETDDEPPSALLGRARQAAAPLSPWSS